MDKRTKIEKWQVGARQEGPRPDIPRKKGMKQVRGQEPFYGRREGLGPHRELKKQSIYLKDQVDYKHATPQQLTKGEQCETCIYWKDGAACHIVLGFIHADMWCNKWEQSEILQKNVVSFTEKGLPLGEPTSIAPVQAKTSSKKQPKQPSIHSHRDDHPTHLHVEIHKEGAGEGGFDGGEGAATVFTSTNSGVFTPTYGERDKKKKKKSGIERLGQFITDNSPEKKMVKSSSELLTDLINDVRMDLQKEDVKRQTPHNSKATEDDPLQVIDLEDPQSEKRLNDPQLVTDQNEREKEQKRIMDEDKKKDGTDSAALLNAQVWGSGPTDVDELHRGGKKDELEADEESNEPEEVDIPDSLELKRLKRALDLEKSEGVDLLEALVKAVNEERED